MGVNRNGSRKGFYLSGPRGVRSLKFLSSQAFEIYSELDGAERRLDVKVTRLVQALGPHMMERIPLSAFVWARGETKRSFEI